MPGERPGGGQFQRRFGRDLDALGAALETWATRDDSKAQPEVTEAGNAALDAIDGMIAELQRARGELIGQYGDHEDAAAKRVDALLARLRHERRDGGS